jgi:hypothetical protein
LLLSNSVRQGIGTLCPDGWNSIQDALMMQRLTDTTVLMAFSLIYRVAVLMLKRRKLG